MCDGSTGWSWCGRAKLCPPLVDRPMSAEEGLVLASKTLKVSGPIWSVRVIDPGVGGGIFRVLVCSGGGQAEVPNTIVSFAACALSNRHLLAPNREYH
jgi:hypothetical protein